MELDRAGLLADTSLTGRQWSRAHSDLVDAWLAKLLQNAAGSVAAHGLALVAVGGYGRQELCPHSDIDVVLVHDDHDDIASIADRIWYPVWDAGLTLGHSVRTVRQALNLATTDLDTATALLSTRHLAGDTALSSDLHERAVGQWQKQAKRWLGLLHRRVEERHGQSGEVAFRLEPDLKNGRGGLRDVHALGWAEEARRILFGSDHKELEAPYDLLLSARVEVQRQAGRNTNTLLLQDQDAVARALAFDDADELMAAIASAARTIAWTSDDAWRRVGSSLRGPLGRIARRDREIEPGLILRDGEVHLAVDRIDLTDASVALRAAALAAAHDTMIDRQSLEELAARVVPLPDPWPPGARDALADLLRTGRAAIPVIEALDQRGIWTRVLPEWLAVRSRPQRNAYHRFTVDRHLLEATANAAALASGVERPDLLVIGTLVHDLGKGLTGDHTERGMELARLLGARMGYADADVDTLVALVEHHLLLPDVATRRDLDDPGTIQVVADKAGTLARLELLAALTEADSLATGPSAWGPWKADLVAELVARAAHVLRGGAVADVAAGTLTPQQAALLDAGVRRVEIDGDVLTVVDRDRPGLFSQVAAVLTLHGVDIVAAAVHTDERGTALEQFFVSRSLGQDLDWSAVVSDLDRMLDGTLDVRTRVAQRARMYAGRSPQRAAPVTRDVAFDNAVSTSSTVVDVHAEDSVGVLYRITDALARQGLDIRSAKVQTMGAQVVDSFYVRDAHAQKIVDERAQAAIRDAVLAAVASAE